MQQIWSLQHFGEGHADAILVEHWHQCLDELLTMVILGSKEPNPVPVELQEQLD